MPDFSALRFKTALACAAISCLNASGAQDNTMTGIFNEDFRTLTTEVDGDRLAPPVISLDGGDCLTIGFDVLREERDYLRYSIYHCDADWGLSNLVDTEVFDGFNYADVTDYKFSRGTAVHYVHYSITVPNDDFRFKLSGNYLLRVYPENEPEDILLQVRFMVSEGAAHITGEATSRTDIDYNKEHQQLSLSVDLNRYPVRDIFNDLKLVVTQNGRSDNTKIITHPSRVNGSSAIYEHIPELIFKGGNEYRRMETVQLTYPGMGVEEIDFHDPYGGRATACKTVLFRQHPARTLLHKGIQFPGIRYGGRLFRGALHPQDASPAGCRCVS